MMSGLTTRVIVVTGMALLAAANAAAQTPAPPPAARAWTFGGSAYTYFLPEEPNYLQPSVTADRGRLHLEARFNYEARDTGSVWGGVNFSGGDAVSWELTPMLGGVFGDTSGVAPGYRGSIAWRALEFYSEGELMFDAGDSADSFFYNWSELALAPLDWLRFGLVTQRTRAYQADRVVQRGLLVGTSIGRLDVTGYLFNPDDSKPIFVLAFAARWD
jgi:hypothetical protein